MPYKLIIAGSRTITSYALIRDAVIESGLWKLHKHNLEIVCGMADGVDLLGKDFAERNRLVWYKFPADWKNLDVPGAVIRYNRHGAYNAAAGHHRNVAMANFADGLVAVYDGKSSGTADMIKIAKSKGLFVYVKEIR